MKFELIVQLVQTGEGQQLIVKSEPKIGTIEALGMLEAAKEYVLRIGFVEKEQAVAEEISD